MMRRMAQMNENTRQGKAAMDGVEDIEILVYEDPEWKAKKKDER